MSHEKVGLVTPTQSIQYKYIITCKDKEIELEVDSQDVFYNADDELDCPLDVVLRKNAHSLNDLMSWNAKEISFVQMTEEHITVIKTFSLNVNL